MIDAVKIATLHVRTGDVNKSHDVFLWRDYGAVCPPIVTSNGVPVLVADAIVGYTNHGKEDIDLSADVESDLVGVDWKDRESIANAFREKYIELWGKP